MKKILAICIALLCAHAARAQNAPSCETGQPRMFSDVPATHLFCGVIEEMARRGITEGCGSGRFCPNATLTRAQMAAFIVNGIGADEQTFLKPYQFTGVPLERREFGPALFFGSASGPNPLVAETQIVLPDFFYGVPLTLELYALRTAPAQGPAGLYGTIVDAETPLSLPAEPQVIESSRETMPPFLKVVVADDFVVDGDGTSKMVRVAVGARQLSFWTPVVVYGVSIYPTQP